MRVALTGPDGDGGSLGEGLRALGVETVGVPLLETVVLEEGGGGRGGGGGGGGGGGPPGAGP